MATEHPPAKVAIPPLAVTSYTGKQPKKRRSEEERKEAVRLKNQRRAKTRVNIGSAYSRWRALRDRLGLTLDAQLAVFLLDSYKKLNEASSSVKPEPATFNPTSGPQQVIDEKPQFTTPCPLSGPLLAKCPSCGYALAQWCLENENSLKQHQPESIEVTLELEERDDPVSGAEEADEESDVSEEESEESAEDDGNDEEEESSDEDWNPSPHYTRTLTVTNSSPTETPNTSPTETTNTSLTETAAAEEESGETEHRPGKWKLCTDCGVFYRKKPHKCEHKTKPFVCNICGRRCVSETSLKIHNRIHSENYEHPCKYCYANFKTRVDKLAHELIHQEQQDPYKCPDCALTFETFNGRADHMKEHGNFKCVVCGIVYREKAQFLRHVVVHTGEKAFKCSVCERSFNQPSHLKSHMRLHTGERPYSCKHCDKSFNHNVSLKSHVQRYHPTEQEDISRQKHETETEKEKESNEEKTSAPSKYKYKRPPTGRPKGRPKRNAAKKRKYLKKDSDNESE